MGWRQQNAERNKRQQQQPHQLMCVCVCMCWSVQVFNIFKSFPAFRLYTKRNMHKRILHVTSSHYSIFLGMNAYKCVKIIHNRYSFVGLYFQYHTIFDLALTAISFLLSKSVSQYTQFWAPSFERKKLGFRRFSYYSIWFLTDNACFLLNRAQIGLRVNRNWTVQLKQENTSRFFLRNSDNMNIISEGMIEFGAILVWVDSTYM